jgi:DNA-binding response OmpR family regulator
LLAFKCRGVVLTTEQSAGQQYQWRDDPDELDRQQPDREAHPAIGIDLAARAVDTAEQIVHFSRLEFELLVKFAADPLRVFSKHELARSIWRGQHVNERTIDSHVCRIRTRLIAAGAEAVLVNKWGHAWSLT